MKATTPASGRNEKSANRRTATGNGVPMDTLTERSILGMMLDAANEGAHVVKPLLERLRPSSFGDIRHRAIFATMQTALDAGQTCDLLAVNGELTKQRQLAAIGGVAYLSELASNGLPRANFDQHARTLIRFEAVRLAQVECASVQKAIASGDQDAALAAIREAQDRFQFFTSLANGTQADNSIVRADPDPWPEPVGTAALLEELASIYCRFVILSEHGPEALALWTLHSYTFEHGEFSPILALISPEKRCGKTTTLHLADCLSRRALFTSNVTAAALFRVIEQHKPTLLIDEFDSISNPERKEDLRNILNGGHNRTGKAIRCDGEDNKPRAFCVFGPKMVASIGDLPDTLMDRAIKLPMRRKLAGETVDRLRRFDATETRRRCVRWARDNAAAIATAKPYLPPVLNDRAADNWEPLLAIAELAGEDWRNRAQEAALALSGETAQGTANLGVELLHDMDAVFAEHTATRMTTSELIDALRKLEERPWASACYGRGISPHYLSKLLKPFGVNSRTIRFGNDSTAKGYDREDLVDPLQRYPLPRQSPETSVTS